MEHPKFCPHCGTAVIGTMQFCTSCGKRVTDAAPTAPAPAKPASRVPLLVVLCVVGVVLLCGVISVLNGGAGGHRQPDAIGAWIDCKDFVTKSLKAPASAVFPASNAPGMSIHSLANGHWVVVGYVDAQNSFGAQLRQAFGCELSYSGTTVTAEHLTIGDQVVQ